MLKHLVSFFRDLVYLALCFLVRCFFCVSFWVVFFLYIFFFVCSHDIDNTHTYIHNLNWVHGSRKQKQKNVGLKYSYIGTKSGCSCARQKIVMNRLFIRKFENLIFQLSMTHANLRLFVFFFQAKLYFCVCVYMYFAGCMSILRIADVLVFHMFTTCINTRKKALSYSNSYGRAQAT